MTEHAKGKFRPGLEPLEHRRPLSAGGAHLPPARAQHAMPGAALSSATDPSAPGSQPGAGDNSITIQANAVKPNHGFLVYRLTNPNMFNNHMQGPFGHVLVQDRQPIPGQTYNVLYVAVRNGTAQTFTASSNLRVRFPGQHPGQSFPILTGNDVWRPGQWFIFYVLTKKYYPIQHDVTQGWEFDLGNARSIAIPGPSGIFLRLKYDPARINRQLDAIVQFGQGAQGGIGIHFGLPDTAIYEFVSAKTRRSDFGGYF
jgi:hypothetical protein